MLIRYQFVELFRDAKSETDINRKTHVSHMKIDHWLSKNCPCDSDLILEKKRDFDFSLKTHDGCGGLCRCRSVCLLMQAALPCMLFARGPMRLHLRGGTNAAFAPQIDYCMQVRPHSQPHSRVLMHCLPCTELPLMTYSVMGGRKGIRPVKN